MPKNNRPVSVAHRALTDPAHLYRAITSRVRGRLGWRDSFPAYHSLRHRTSRIAINNAALSFWTSAARHDPAFGPIYSRDDVQGPALAPSLPQPPRSVNDLVDSVQRYGFALLEDFLPDSKMRVVRDEFDRLPAEPDRIMGNGAALFERRASPRFLELFDDVIRQITARVYGRPMEPPQTTTVDRVELMGNDTDDPNTILHIDRFLPCIKVFYYPHAISDPDQSPYGFVPGSHIINDRYLASVREAFAELPHGAKPFAMRNPTDNAETSVLTGGNSLLLTYTNGLHRRTPFGPTAAQGSFRESAMFMFYDDYTRKDLLSNLFRR